MSCKQSEPPPDIPKKAERPLPKVVRCETLEEFARLAAALPCSCPACVADRRLRRIGEFASGSSSECGNP